MTLAARPPIPVVLVLAVIACRAEPTAHRVDGAPTPDGVASGTVVDTPPEDSGGGDSGEAETEPGAEALWAEFTPSEYRYVDVDVTSSANTVCVTCGDGRIECHNPSYPPILALPDLPYVAVAASYGYVCGLVIDGTLRCAYDDSAEAGGDWGPVDVPAGAFVQVDAGTDFVCALGADGLIHCWGDEGDGDGGSWNARLEAPAGEFSSIAVAGQGSCALDGEGAAACWGRSDNEISDEPEVAFRQVSADGWDACGIQTDGSTLCWGDDLDDPQDSVLPLPSWPLKWVGVGDDPVFYGVDMGDELYCWGRTDERGLCPAAGKVSGVPAFRAFSEPGSAAAGISVDDELWYWLWREPDTDFVPAVLEGLCEARS